jgi:hypothetical protein
VPPLSHLTSCSPTKSNLYFDITFATVTSEPALYRFLTFQVTNLVSIFLSLRRLSKGPVRVRGQLWRFVTNFFFTARSYGPTPTPKMEDHFSSAVFDSVFNIFAATLHIWRPSPPSATWGRAMPWWQRTYLTHKQKKLAKVRQFVPLRK